MTDNSDNEEYNATVDIGAKIIAAWMHYDWNGLSDIDRSDRFPDWLTVPEFHGGKPALRKIVESILDNTIAALRQELEEANAEIERLTWEINSLKDEIRGRRYEFARYRRDVQRQIEDLRDDD